MSWKRIVYALVILVVAGISALSGVIAGGMAVYSAVKDRPAPVAIQPEEQIIEITQPVNQIINTQVETAITTAVESIGPAVVTVVGIVPGQVTFFGRSSDQPVSGSGVIISEEGYILTNNHVIADTTEISVILADGTELAVEVIGADAFSDLAVLKASGQMPAVASLGNSDALRPGETVIAIGSPLGDFKNTVTAGVVSGTERMIEVNQGYRMEGLIQTDAAINQGNSGGPLVNLAGEVIGINTLIVRGGGYGSAVAEGLGFAISVNTAKAVSVQLVDKGYFSYPYLGIRWQWLTPGITRRYNLPVDGGVYVSDVNPESPADEAGIESGDIITHLGDIKLDEENPYINTLYAHSPGDLINLKIVRDQDFLDFSITLGEHPTP